MDMSEFYVANIAPPLIAVLLIIWTLLKYVIVWYKNNIEPNTQFSHELLLNLESFKIKRLDLTAINSFSKVLLIIVKLERVI